MLGGQRGQLGRRRKLRRMGRVARAALPTVVWGLAIVGAVCLYSRSTVMWTLKGYAEVTPITLTHFEPGTVREVHVSLYEIVSRGQILVSMDDHEERIQLAAVEQDIERLGAVIVAEQARLATDNARATADVRDLGRRFAIDRESAHIAYLSQLVVTARDRVTLAGLLVEYDVLRDLDKAGNASFLELNDIQTRVNALQATVATNATVLERQKQAFEDADQRWIEFMQRADIEIPFDPVLTPLRLAIGVRERDIEEIARRIDAHVLRAPVDGRVAMLGAHAGDRVQPDTLLVSLAPTFTNEIIAYLPEDMAFSVAAGAPVRVSCTATVAGQPREYTGKVIRVSPIISEAPPRYRPIPNYPVWGRGLVIGLDQGVRLIPGEAVAIILSKDAHRLPVGSESHSNGRDGEKKDERG
jgi:multidrug resistance efflux pump